MEQLELEGIAAAMLREGGQESDEAPQLGRLATALLGPNSVEYTLACPGDGALVRVHGQWRIYVRHRLSIERRAFAVAHELVEWWLRTRENYLGEDVEHCANYGAAAILAPRRAFLIALRALGSDLTALADEFGITESHAALREAEVTRIPRALVSPALVRVRGDESFVWPDEQTIRGWARRARPGIRKIRLKDDPRRVVLDAIDTQAESA